jgi:hypothetical protein
VESERPPQILLGISPRRPAGAGPLLRLAAALAFADVLASLGTALAHREVGHKVVGRGAVPVPLASMRG